MAGTNRQVGDNDTATTRQLNADKYVPLIFEFDAEDGRVLLSYRAMRGPDRTITTINVSAKGARSLGAVLERMARDARRDDEEPPAELILEGSVL